MLLLAMMLAFGSVQARIPWRGDPYFITTRGAKVADVLKDLGANYGVPVIVSPKVNDHFVGTVRNEMPDVIIERFTQLFNLATYYDGQALYVYKGHEIKSQIITPRYLSTQKLIRYLSQGGAKEQKYCSLRTISNFNALEVFGVPMCVERVSELAKNLDEKVLDQAQNQETVQVFPLRFASADDNIYNYRKQEVRVPGVVSVLREMIQGRSPIGEGVPLTSASGSLPIETTLPAFSADSRQNAIVVRDRQVNMPIYAKLIKQLDTQPAQIEISVAIIDVNAANLSALGVNWSGTANIGGKYGVSFNTGLPQGSSATINSVLNDTNGFMVRLNALEQHSQAKILSRPSVVTLNNVQAVLDRSITFYTKLEGENVARLESVSAGSLLRVTPRLIKNGSYDQIMLTLNIQDGRQTEPISGNHEQLPQIANAEIATQATLLPGQSLLLGGFVQDQQMQGESRVPLLGEIPVLGNLFRNKNGTAHSVVRLFLIKAEPQPIGPQPALANLSTSPANEDSVVEEIAQ
ncbi:EscC/YscC/HrcC family type III secretion system outer membrane ring protein [Mycoavidus sp. B2-EB]|uniref:EscC/YscC/HrcC family type III secretion system outer membrane ring protein n=1 Tax=Mycoavidus sp. B2-EB TaxID=2651972 RepID=UPI00351BEF3D